MTLDTQVAKLMKANHTSQIYRLEDNIAKHYPQQISTLKERISGLTADIRTVKEKFPADKEQFVMKIGNKVYADKKEAGAAIVEMCREMKHADVSAMVGEYAGFQMSVSYDSWNSKFGSMSMLWTKKVERLCCFFKFLILLLLWCYVTNRTVYSFSVIPALYVFKNCSAGFL